MKTFKVKYKDEKFLVKANNEKDAVAKVKKKYKDERLSPMTYKKLKEMGYSSEDWQKLSQEQANKIVQGEGKKSTNNKESVKSKPSETNESSKHSTNESHKSALKEIKNVLEELELDEEDRDPLILSPRSIEPILENLKGSKDYDELKSSYSEFLNSGYGDEFIEKLKNINKESETKKPQQENRGNSKVSNSSVNELKSSFNKPLKSMHNLEVNRDTIKELNTALKNIERTGKYPKQSRDLKEYINELGNLVEEDGGLVTSPISRGYKESIEYILKSINDSKTFKVTHKDKKYLVKAKDFKDAANKVSKLKDDYVIYNPKKDKYIGLSKLSKKPYWVDKKYRDIFTLEDIGNIINDLEKDAKVIKLKDNLSKNDFIQKLENKGIRRYKSLSSGTMYSAPSSGIYGDVYAVILLNSGKVRVETTGGVFGGSYSNIKRVDLSYSDASKYLKL